MLLKCCASKCVSYHLNTIWKYVQCCTLIDIPLYQRLLCLRCRCHKRCASDEPVTAERIRPASSGDLMRSLCMWVRRAADSLPGNRLHHTLHQWKFKSDPLRLRKWSEMYGWLSCANSFCMNLSFSYICIPDSDSDISFSARNPSGTFVHEGSQLTRFNPRKKQSGIINIEWKRTKMCRSKNPEMELDPKTVITLENHLCSLSRKWV